MIKVIETHLYGVFPEEIISDNLIKLIENKFKKNQDFAIKSVPKKTDPKEISNPTIGFYSPYGIVYISNPEKKKGLIAVDFSKKILIYNPNEETFFEQRDSVVYIQTTSQYIRESYTKILEEFQTQGYNFHKFSQKDNSNSIANFASTKELDIGKQLKLEELL